MPGEVRAPASATGASRSVVTSSLAPQLAPAFLRALSGADPVTGTAVPVPATHVLVAVTLLAPLPATDKAGMLCGAFAEAAGSPPGLADFQQRPHSMSGGSAVEMLYIVQGVAASLAAVVTPPALNAPATARFEALLDAYTYRLVQPAARSEGTAAAPVATPLSKAEVAVAALPRARGGDRELDCIPTAALQRVLSCQLPWAALLRLWCSPDRMPTADLRRALQKGAEVEEATSGAGEPGAGVEEEEEEEDKEEEERLLRGLDATSLPSPLSMRARACPSAIVPYRSHSHLAQCPVARPGRRDGRAMCAGAGGVACCGERRPWCVWASPTHSSPLPSNTLAVVLAQGARRWPLPLRLRPPYRPCPGALWRTTRGRA